MKLRYVILLVLAVLLTATWVVWRMGQKSKKTSRGWEVTSILSRTYLVASSSGKKTAEESLQTVIDVCEKEGFSVNKIDQPFSPASPLPYYYTVLDPSKYTYTIIPVQDGIIIEQEGGWKIRSTPHGNTIMRD